MINKHLITLITIEITRGSGARVISQYSVAASMSSLHHLSCFICRKEIGKISSPIRPFDQLSGSGETERCHHVEGRIYCEDDFILSGHSRCFKSCLDCGELVTNKLVQVNVTPDTKERCKKRGQGVKCCYFP